MNFFLAVSTEAGRIHIVSTQWTASRTQTQEKHHRIPIPQHTHTDAIYHNLFIPPQFYLSRIWVAGLDQVKVLLSLKFCYSNKRLAFSTQRPPSAILKIHGAAKRITCYKETELKSSKIFISVTQYERRLQFSNCSHSLREYRKDTNHSPWPNLE